MQTNCEGARKIQKDSVLRSTPAVITCRVGPTRSNTISLVATAETHDLVLLWRYIYAIAAAARKRPLRHLLVGTSTQPSSAEAAAPTALGDLALTITLVATAGEAWDLEDTPSNSALAPITGSPTPLLHGREPLRLLASASGRSLICGCTMAALAVAGTRHEFLARPSLSAASVAADRSAARTGLPTLAEPLPPRL